MNWPIISTSRAMSTLPAHNLKSCCSFVFPDISDAHHYLVTRISERGGEDSDAVPLFLTLKDQFVVEKNFTGKVC